MKDREKYIEHVKSEANRIQLRKLLDKIDRVLRKHEVEYTEFLDPYEVKLSESILNRFDLNYIACGGNPDSERKVMMIFPEYLSAEDIESPIVAIKIEGNFKFNSISHRDYLGAMIGTGVKREKLGDIYVSEKFATAVLHRDILDYVKLNLTKIGRENIRVEDLQLSELEIPKEDYEERVIVVSSMRLDSVISEIYGISRAKSKSIVISENVKLNWCMTEDPAAKVFAGDMVSVKRFGRSRIIEELGSTKKDNLRLKIRIYK